MSLQSSTNRNDYTGSGSTATYAYSFKIFADTDLVVTKRLISTGVETTLALTTDYTVSGVGDTAGGSITLVAGNLASTYHLTIRRVRPLTQTLDIRNQGDYFPERTEDAFDKASMVDQQQQDEIDRSLKLTETVAAAGFDPTIPADVASTAGATFIVNATLDGLEMGPTADDISNAQGYALTASQWATKTTGQVASTDYSAKAYAIGGTGITSTATKGAAKEWATTTGAAVDTVDYSAKEYATGTFVPTGSAKDWASKTSATVITSTYSAKEYAQGTQASTGGSAKNWAQQTAADVTGAAANSRSAKSWAQDVNTGATLQGSAKDWAQNTSVPVDGSTGYSAKEWAVGTQTRGVASSGSAKDWATYTSGTVDGTSSSAKQYALNAAASATAAQAAVAAMVWGDVSFKTANFSVAQADSGTLFSIDTTSGNVAVTLPAIAGLDLTNPLAFGFVKSSSDTNTVTLNRASTDTFNPGAGTSFVLNLQNQGATLVPDIDPAPDQWTTLSFGPSQYYDGGVASNTQRFTLPKASKTTLDGLTRKQGTVVYASDTNKTYVDNGTTLKQIGSGQSGRNYLEDFFDFESDFTASAVTNLTATGNRTSNTTVWGGSTTGLQANETSSKLRGTQSGKLTLTGASAAQFVETPLFTLDLQDSQAGKPIQIAFDMNASSAGHAVGDIDLVVIRYDSSGNYVATITPDVTQIPPGYYAFKAVFTPSSTTTDQYAVRWRSQNASARIVILDSLSVGPLSLLSTDAISKWQAFTPVWAGLGTATFTTNKGWKRRVGDTLELLIEANFSANGSGASSVQVALPDSLAMDTTIVDQFNTRWALGYNSREAAGAITTNEVMALDANNLRFQKNASAGGLLGTDITSGDSWALHCWVPISNWTVPINISTGREEYAANSSTSDAADTSSFVYGPDGSALPGALTATRAKRVRFKTPIQPTDVLLLEVFVVTQSKWMPYNANSAGSIGYTAANSVEYGCYLGSVSGSETDIDVNFCRYAAAFGATTYGGAGTAWTSITGSISKWRLRKCQGVAVSQAYDYEEGTIAVNFNAQAGVSGANLTTNFIYRRIGKQVLIDIPNKVDMTAGSTANQFSTAASTIPSRLCPATSSRWFPARVQANSVVSDSPGYIQFDTDGTVKIVRTLSAGTNFTATQTNNGINAMQVGWSLA